MPPDSPPFEENNSAGEPTPLTDENVAILYQIIKSAEQYPDVDTLPFRAMFAAYETILPENGLDPDHDQIYLRFLFKLGNSRREEQSLYKSFEMLLEDMGFQIEFVPDEEGIPGIAQSNNTEETRERLVSQKREINWHSGRSRRSSFNSMYDGGDESTEPIGSEHRSRASMSRLDISQRSVLDARPSTRATTRKTEKIHTHDRLIDSPTKQARRGRLTAEEFAKSLQYARTRRRSLSTQPSRTEQQSVPPDNTTSHPRHASAHLLGATPEMIDDGSEDEIKALTVPRLAQSSYNFHQYEKMYNLSRTQLFRDAETFHHFRIRSVARDIVDRWCDAALQAKDRHEHLDRLAAAHDTEILLQQAFEHWRLRLHAKKQVAATERYFKHEERRVARARDLMLLSKAFTHWSQCALEEKIRTTDARQQVLSVKYFQAWRNITVTNQLSVRQQGLLRFFRIWKRRYVGNLTDGIRAELLYRENIARNIYWRWFWAFCERRAPEWRAARLRRKYLAHWINVLRTINRQDRYISTKVDSITQRQALYKWLGTARLVATSQRQAAAFSRQKELTHILQCWRRNCVYTPIIRQVSNMVDWRVAGATFATFVARYRFERQAEVVCRLRVARNAWTLWNDRLRCQILAHRVDDRYCLEALYRWVISERCVLLQRLSHERLKQRYLSSLRNQYLALQVQRDRSFQIIAGAQRKRLLKSSLVYWKSRQNSSYKDGRIAFEFYAPKLVQDAFLPWTQRFLHLQSMDSMAQDICFYFVSRRILKRWHVAFLESRKQRRKNAYIQIRRKQKIILARGVFYQWRGSSDRISDIQQQANLTNQGSLLKYGTILFDRWKSKFDMKRNQDFNASQHYERRLLERYLYTWIEGLEDRSRREEVAELNYDMRLKNVAFTWFKKLRLKIIEFKGQEANAESLRSWYEKRHSRIIFRHWQDTAAKKLSPQEEPELSSRLVRARPRAMMDEGPTSRAENWTEFDIGDWIPALEVQSSTTPIPAYLSTPSKRAARAKALVRASTTPAGTPFEQRLRSQIGLTPRSTRRVGLGKSTGALKGSAFGAILEDSPRTPGMEREG